MQGIFMVVRGRPNVKEPPAAVPQIKLLTRVLMGLGLASWLSLPISTAGIVLQLLYPFDLPYIWIDVVLSWVAATGFYMYFIGYVRQFNIHR